MKHEDFNDLCSQLILHCDSTLIAKTNEYSSSEDRLHNFKVAARITNSSPVQALLGMKAKHTVSILDMCHRHSLTGQVQDKDYVFEKIGDEINYLILLAALLLEAKDDITD